VQWLSVLLANCLLVQLVRRSSSMAIHHPHLLDFSLPPSTVAAMDEAPPPPSFDHGQLLALHADGTDTLSSLGGGLPTTTHRVLADDTAAWPPPQGAVSLSLYNYSDTAGGSSSLFSHGQQHHQFAVPPAAAVSLQAPNDRLLPTPSVQPSFQLRSSKYLGPVQDLLAAFCSLEGDMNGGVNKRAPQAAGKWEDVEPSSSSSGLWGHPSLMSSMDLLELERRKSRLLSMVEEVGT